MTTYQFIQKNYDDNQNTPFLAISTALEDLKLSDTYGNYGQAVQPEEAGDSIELRTVKAVEIANQVAEELELENTFEIGSIINSHENSELYDNVFEQLTEEDYAGYFNMVEGFNYWDGNNWATVTVKSDMGEPSHTLILDEELVKELNQAIEDAEFISEGHGTRTYDTDKYRVVSSQFSSHFESFEVYLKSELDEL
ncbi:MAG: hypothetical protein RBT57_02765 [Paludibacter sp.]|jgi:hypothetical protein|nr:hypothetical protein [Paludibacter sp.]